MPTQIHPPAKKQAFVAALLSSRQLTPLEAEALLIRGNWLMQEAETFFAPMAGSLSSSDRQVQELELFIWELEAADAGVVRGTRIRGERAIEFCAGWGRLRIYVIRDRFARVDLLDCDAETLKTGKKIIASMGR